MPPAAERAGPSPEAAADAAEWRALVAREVASTDRAYALKSDFLIGHARAERATAKDYALCEFLELLQNAADAAALADVPRRVRIEADARGSRLLISVRSTVWTMHCQQTRLAVTPLPIR